VAPPPFPPSDHLVLAAALLTCNAVGREPWLLRIADTLHLERFWVSASLLDQVREHPALTVIDGPCAPALDDEGTLRDLGKS
jgi:hypothetical protein